MTARSNGRTAVELERERNQATVETIKVLPPGAELLENEPNGRLRVIRIPRAETPVRVVSNGRIVQPTGELGT